MASLQKILIATPLYPPEIGGPATYVKFLEENLPKEKFELRIIRFGDVKHLPYIIRHIVFFFRVLKGAKDCDAIYALDPLGTGVPAGLASKILGKEFFLRIAGDRAWETALQKYKVRDSLDVFSHQRKYNFSIRLLKYGQEFGAFMADKIITPSEYLRGIISNWGINPEKIFVIHNAFTPILITDTKEELREIYGLKGSVLFSAGRMVPWKGFETLISILPDILISFPETMLVVAGDGPEENHLRNIVKKLSLEKHVVFLGRVPKETVLRYMRASDIFLLNTFYEGFSHELLEALSVGAPIITTNVGGNPELLENGKEGILLSYNDEEGFKRSITRLLKDSNLREKFSVAGEEKLKQWSVERAVSEILKQLS